MNFQFFDRIRNNDLNHILNICSRFKYEKFSPGETVFAQGDRTKFKFYFILEGRVGL